MVGHFSAGYGHLTGPAIFLGLFLHLFFGTLQLDANPHAVPSVLHKFPLQPFP